MAWPCVPGASKAAPDCREVLPYARGSQILSPTGAQPSLWQVLYKHPRKERLCSGARTVTDRAKRKVRSSSSARPAAHNERPPLSPRLERISPLAIMSCPFQRRLGKDGLRSLLQRQAHLGQ
ncbi:tumor protein p63-regulated protein 1 [Platysternon megacephalum]|uniref:Tumor protein p63-regulated protein 1 n=1 Tax=Platysternon megacephalum TaxID=55544 RepID=A0A4D9EE39_9SAUR|nr:tumor protein p63-regulated protein 1 [Platysternon megacephalum]